VISIRGERFWLGRGAAINGQGGRCPSTSLAIRAGLGGVFVFPLVADMLPAHELRTADYRPFRCRRPNPKSQKDQLLARVGR
jgi:hypothetical protein